jgi:hypothetical protein
LSFFERGLAIPTSEFLCHFFVFYHIQLHDLSPN